MSVFSYITNRNIIVQGFGEKAMRMAQTIASAIDPEQFDRIVETREPDEYWYSVQALLDRTINETDVLFIYTLFPGYADGVVTYFAAGIAVGRELPVYFGQTDPAEYFSPEMFHAMNEGVATMSGIYYAGEFGMLIGGFAPIIDDTGRVVGLVCVELSVSNVVASVNRFVFTMVVFAFGLSLVFFVLAMPVANNVFVKPIKTLAETLSSADGGYSRYKFPASPINEMNVLFDSFGKMVSMEVAEESNKSKNRFLARMSHEIRTPITAVLGISEVELWRSEPSPNPKESFAKIHNSASILLGIVNDILDLSKIEAEKMEMLCDQYDTASMINDITHTHLAYLGDRDLKFRITVSEDLPCTLVGDALRIKQIMNNLLSNAFKYTESGSVDLSVSWDGEDLLVSIRDTGLGMLQEQINALHNDYTRFHERELRHIGGAGLGMPIVYYLTHMMGGKISLESEMGKGTFIAVSIPQKTVGVEVLGNELARSLERFESAAWTAAKKFDFVPEPMPHGRVLVVDDVDTNLYVVEAMLNAYGLNIELCGSGKSAIDKIKQGNVYDVIFMDHMMPEMDGIESTKIIRGVGYTHPIVAFSANTLKEYEELFRKSGFSGFMPKPIDINRLDAFLKLFVSKGAKVTGTATGGEGLDTTPFRDTPPIHRTAGGRVHSPVLASPALH